MKAVLDSLKVAEQNYETQQARIGDLKAQIQTLYDQLHTKDEQIKDQMKALISRLSISKC